MSSLPATKAVPVRPISYRGVRWGRLGVFSYRGYQLYSAATFLSFCAITVQMMTRAWMVQRLTDSPFLVSMVPALQIFPMLFLSFLGGELADRFSRKKILVLGEAASLASFAVLAALAITGAVQVWHILLLTLVLGTSTALALPSRQALVIDVVPQRDQRAALGLYMVVFNLSQIAAPALAGLLIGRYGTEASLLVSTILFAPVLPLFASLRPISQTAHVTRRLGTLEGLKAGVGYITGNARLRWMFLALFVVVLGANSWGALFPTFTENVLGREAAGLGMIVLGVGVGATIGSFAAMTLDGRASDKAIQLWSGALFSLAVVILAFTTSFWAWVGMAMIAALAGTVFFVHNMMAAQLTAPENVRGRVVSARFVVSGLQPFGHLALGAMAEGPGPQVALASFAVASAVGLGALWLVTRTTPGTVREPAV